MEPLHVMYSYKSNAVDIINGYPDKFSGLKVKATVYNLDGTEKLSKETTTEVDADGTKQCIALPDIDGLSNTYFLRLELKDAEGKVRSINWYWLSAKKDELNWKKSTWFYTPQSAYTNYQGLQNLPLIPLRVNYTTEKNATQTTQHIRITNSGKAIAFFVHLRMLKKKAGDDILPVIFDDNYLLLAPGESRNVDCRYLNKDAGDTVPYLLTSAWNLDVNGSKSEKNAGFINEMK